MLAAGNNAGKATAIGTGGAGRRRSRKQAKQHELEALLVLGGTAQSGDLEATAGTTAVTTAEELTGTGADNSGLCTAEPVLPQLPGAAAASVAAGALVVTWMASVDVYRGSKAGLGWIAALSTVPWAQVPEFLPAGVLKVVEAASLLQNSVFYAHILCTQKSKLKLRRWG